MTMRGVMAGSLLIGLIATAALAGGPPAAKSADAKGAEGRKVEISVTENGFEPSSSTVAKGEQVTLVFTRKTDKTCATSVIVYMDPKTKVEKDLPLNTPVSIPLTAAAAGDVKFTCGMNMYTGVVKLQ